MATPYTKEVTKSIKEMGRKSKKILDITTEDDIWMGVQDKKHSHTTYFRSDATIEMSNSKFFIFQICDSESDDPKKIFGDFFTSFLSREVSKIYFITQPNKKDYVENICKIIKHILIKKIKINEKRIVKYKVIGITENLKKIGNQIEEMFLDESLL